MLKPLKLKKIISIAVGVGLVIGSVASAEAVIRHRTAVDHHSCSEAAPGSVSCLAIKRVVSVNGIAPRISSPRALIEPNGSEVFGMRQLRQAYGITALGSKNNVIVVVDAYHSASAFADLNYYRSTFGYAPLVGCGIATSEDQCFRQYHQDGSRATGSTTDQGWAQETVLDVEMATAMCPNCSISVVETDTPSFDDFNTAVEFASTIPGVQAISNSYGGPEANERDYPAYEHAYQKGIAVVASAGDSGFGVESPASFQHVIAVGGTSLYANTRGTYSRETAWSGSGSGCARGPAPEWQEASITHCNGKAIADVSAVADPATGVAVYFESQWMIFGGTSASAPIIAGLLALKHNFGAPGSSKDTAGQYIWNHRDRLHDVASGNNGRCRNFCTSITGWDGPTGLGTPQGTGGF